MEATMDIRTALGAEAAEISSAMKAGKLYPRELFWRNHCSWLKDCGYVLRRRFQPDWAASWLNSSRFWAQMEDSVVSDYVHLLDATRSSDGAQVILKYIKSSDHPDEVNIGQLFSSEPLVSDPRNHCVPAYEILQVPDDKDIVILVMPFLLKIEQVPFDTIGEAVEFFRQIFEGLQFMHQHHVSHRDVKYNNIMMGGLSLYREPPHPFSLDMNQNYTRKSKIRWTRTRKPVNYYFIDFGLSKQYPSDGRVYLDVPGGAGDKTIPEFLRSDGALCDPFAVDVYCLGNLIRRYFLEGYSSHSAKKGFEFMTDLVADMVKDIPTERPTMDEIVERYATIMNGLSDQKLRSRVIDKEEKPLERHLRTFTHWCRQTLRRLLRVPAIPTP